MDWQRLEVQEQKKIWLNFTKSFQFQPSVDSAGFPGLRPPSPNAAFNVDLGAHSVEEFTVRAAEFNSEMEAVAAKALRPGTPVLSLLWHHVGYYATIDSSVVTELHLPNPLYPDGDYPLFIAADFSTGIFGHPWERSVCVFGEPLIEPVTQLLGTRFELLRSSD